MKKSNETLTQIEGALRALPLLPEVTDETLEHVARCVLGLGFKLPDITLIERTVKQELLRVAKAMEACATAMDETPEAITVLTDECRLRPRELRAQLSATAGAARARAGKVPRRKKPHNVVANSIGLFLADQFEVFTGRRAAVSSDPVTHKAGGRFFRLVREVLTAMDVSASAETVAREAVRQRREGKTYLSGPLESSP